MTAILPETGPTPVDAPAARIAVKVEAVIARYHAGRVSHPTLRAAQTLTAVLAPYCTEGVPDTELAAITRALMAVHEKAITAEWLAWQASRTAPAVDLTCLPAAAEAELDGAE